MAALNWNKAKHHGRSPVVRPTEYRTVPADKAFWQAWRDDPIAMRAAGYSVRKANNGWVVQIRR